MRKGVRIAYECGLKCVWLFLGCWLNKMKALGGRNLGIHPCDCTPSASWRPIQCTRPLWFFRVVLGLHPQRICRPEFGHLRRWLGIWNVYLTCKLWNLEKSWFWSFWKTHITCEPWVYIFTTVLEYYAVSHVSLKYTRRASYSGTLDKISINILQWI